MIPLPTFTLLCGPKGSGKSTLSRLLQEQDRDLCVMSFAEPIRMALLATFHPEEMTLGIDLREEEVKARQIPGTNVTYREWMMKYGDWMKQMFTPYIFVDLAKRTIDSQAPYWRRFIFDDCRFLEEVVGLTNAGASPLIIHIERGAKPLPHFSEFGVTGNQGTVITGPSFPIPSSIRRVVIRNDASPESMLAQLETLLCPEALPHAASNDPATT